MMPDRWDRIEHLVEQALSLPPENRAALLEKECASDEKLKKEVESLLLQSDTADTFISDITENVVSPSIAEMMEEKIRRMNEDHIEMIGQNVAHYQITEILGSGGMGVVYKARDTRLDRTVALKFLSEKNVKRKAEKEKLFREAKAAAALNHPNIATIYEINESDGLIFISMEYVDGVTLRCKIKEHTIPAIEALNYACEIAGALSEAHEKGVIHRDIKPENIMLDSRNRIKVMDFGLAHFGGFDEKSLSITCAGTPDYMPPEMIRDKVVGPKGDLWSLGVVMYEMLSGKHPFEDKTRASVLHSILHDEVTPLRKLEKKISEEVDTLVGNLLRKDPNDRCESAADFLTDCQSLLNKSTPGPGRYRKSTPNTVHAPSPLTGFIGRKNELTELKKNLENHRLITLTGVAGSGKTRLAIELAHNLPEHVADRIHFIDLSSIRDPAAVMPAISRSLNLKEAAGRTISETLKSYLRTKRWLLILDNFEQVSDAAPEIAELLMNAPDCKIIVTSRQPLNIQGEYEFPVPPLKLPSVKSDLNERALGYIEATALFIQRAQQVRPDFEVIPDNKDQIAEICNRLDGLPLAIELAAVRIKMLTAGELLQRLNDRFRLLACGTADLPKRQRSLRAAIEWSYDLLTDDEQILFRRLAVFTDGFTLEAVTAVCSEMPAGHTDVLDTLSSLLSKNLIYKSETAGDSLRFNMLESIREFASDCLSQSGEYVLLRDTHRNFFVEFCKLAMPHATGSDQTEWVQKLDKDYANLLKALEWKSGLDEQQANSLLICNVLWRYWLRKCLFSEGRSRIRELINNTHIEQNRELVAEVLLGAGTLAHNNGDYEDAFRNISRSLDLFRAKGSRDKIAKALTNLGWAEFRRGNYREAEKLSEEALLIYQELNDPSGIAFALNNLGWVAHHRGEYDRALDYHKECLKLRKDIGNVRNIAFSLTNYAWAVQKLGRYDEAEKLLDESIHLFNEADEQQLYIFARCLMAETLADSGKTNKARVLLSNIVVPGFKEIEDTYGFGLALNLSGVTSFREGDYPQAEAYLTESLKIRRELGDKWGTAQSLNNLGRVLIHSKKVARALPHLKESYSIRRNIEDKHGLADTLEGFSEYFHVQKNNESSYALADISSALRAAIHSPPPVETGTLLSTISDSQRSVDHKNPFLISNMEKNQINTEELLKAAEKILPFNSEPDYHTSS
jgi:predicted ATPase/tRNA A-37 threonylcarbamoyl transferase component Bud32